MRWMRIAGAVALVLVLVVVGVVIALNRIDWSEYQQPVVDAVYQATGRELAVDGELRLQIGLRPGVAVEGVRFQNADWGSRPEMAEVGRFSVQLALWPLFLGRLEVARVVLSDVDVLIETDASGRSNTEFEPPPGAPAEPGAEPEDGGAPDAEDAPAETPSETETEAGPVTDLTSLVREVWIENAVLVQLDGATGERLEVAIDRLRARMTGDEGRLELDLAARYDGEPIGLKAAVDGAGRVLAGGSIELDAEAEAGGATLRVKGPVGTPLEGRDFSLKVALSGERLDGLSGLAGTDVPALGPYSLSATVSDEEKRYRVESLDLKMGASRVRGSIVADLGGERPRVEAKLGSPLLRAEDFGGPASAAAEAPGETVGAGETSDEEAEAAPVAAREADPSAEPAPAGASDRVFPDDPLPLDGLAAADAVLDLTIDRLETGIVDLRAVQVGLELEDRALAIEPLRAELLSGAMDAALALDASRRAPALALRVDLDQIDSGEALIAFDVSDALQDAKVDAVVDVRGAGASVRRIMASLGGDLELSVGPGSLRRDFVEAQLGQWAPLVIDPEKSREARQANELNCIVARFDVETGVARSRGVAVDLMRVALLGDGRIDLRDETLDVDLEPIVKDAQLDLVTPAARVGGTLAAPEFGLDTTGLANKAVGIAEKLAQGDSIVGGKNLRTSTGIAGCDELIERSSELRESGGSGGKKAKKKLKKTKKKLRKKGGKAVKDAIGDLFDF